MKLNRQDAKKQRETVDSAMLAECFADLRSSLAERRKIFTRMAEIHKAAPKGAVFQVMAGLVAERTGMGWRLTGELDAVGTRTVPFLALQDMAYVIVRIVENANGLERWIRGEFLAGQGMTRQT